MPKKELKAKKQSPQRKELPAKSSDPIVLDLGKDKPKHPGGRPTKLTPELIEYAKTFLLTCGDFVDYVKPNGDVVYNVELPSHVSLAIYLGISKSTLYEWAKESKEFSDIIEEVSAAQEKFLLRGGVSGKYNPSIAKVILTKHGYREGQDITTNDKDLPQPILGGITKKDGIQ